MSEKSLIRIQAVSGLIFSVFLVLHLLNTAAGALSQDVYDRFMAVARLYYQLPVVEIVGVVGAAVVHMGTGLARAWRRRSRRAPTNLGWRVRLHRYSGYYLMLAFVGHVAATRGPGLLGYPADLSFVHLSLAYAGVFFYPYYVLLGVGGAYHLTHGVIVALRALRVRLPAALVGRRSVAFGALAVLASMVVLTGVLGLGGHLYEVDTSRFVEWQGLYESLVPWAPLPWRAAQ